MRTRAMTRVAVGMLALASAACVTRVEPASAPGVAGVGPALVVEQFLAAANANDLDTMARLFGTDDGPIEQREPMDTRDQWMFAVASVLRHDDYQLAGNTIVPGRRDRATQVNVRMRFGERQIMVPFIVLNTEKWGWMVENVDLRRITNPPPRPR